MTTSYLLAGVKGERRAEQERNRTKEECPGLNLKASGEKAKKKKKKYPTGSLPPRATLAPLQ